VAAFDVLPGSWSDAYFGENPQAAYARFLRGAGLYGTDARARYMQDQYQRRYQSFLAGQPEQPDKTFLQILQEEQPAYEREFASLPAAQRGVQVRASVGPLRWIL